MDYRAVIEKLKEMAQKQYDLGFIDEGAAIENDMEKLQAWVDSGQVIECPIDLEKYGLSDLVTGSEAQPDLKRVAAKKPAAEKKPASSSKPVPVRAEKPKREESARATEAETASQEIQAILEDVDSPEQAELRRQLEQARKHYKDGQLREAVALSTQVESRAVDASLKERAKDLQDQAGNQLKTAIRKAITEGDKARAAGKKDEAHKHYQNAINLDPKNQDVIRALMELEGGITSKSKLREEIVRSLASGLKERKDIKRLGETVYEAEAYDKEGKLSGELPGLLAEARKFYDGTRISHGDTTTAMHFGNLEGRSKAVKEITDWVATGQKYIYDAATNTEKPAFDLLQEANKSLEMASEDTAQYELVLANKQLPAHPQYAKSRLEAALQKPFSDYYRRKLEEKLSEVEALIQLQNQAEKLTTRENGAVDIFRLTLEFYKTFPDSPGRESQIAQVRQMALSSLTVQINNLRQKSDLNLRMGEYEESRDWESQAQRLASTWPVEEKPTELKKAIESLGDLRQKIDIAEKDWDEYRRLAKAIRDQVIDSSQRASALDLFKKVSEDPRFKAFPDLAILTSEIDNYTDIGEKLVNAQAARMEGDWARVFELTDKVIKSGKAGQLFSNFKELYDKASIEIAISRAKALLEDDDVPEANNILSAVLNREKGSPREAELRNRLEVELAKILRCIADNPSMQLLYDRASELIGLRDAVLLKAYINPTFALRQARINLEGQATNPEMRTLINNYKKNQASPDPTAEELGKLVAPELRKELAKKGVAERLEALRLYRYVGGDLSRADDKEKTDWRLSLRAAEARRASRLLVDSLRQDVIAGLVNAYNFREEKTLSDAVLQRLAESARGLREAELLDTEDEKDAGRWLEVKWGEQQSKVFEERGDWNGAVNIWDTLRTVHKSPEAQDGWRRVRIQQAVEASRDFLNNHHNGEEAKAVLDKVKNEPGIGNSWEVEVALAQTYAVLGNFDSAFGSWEEAYRFTPEDKRLRASLQEIRKELDQEKDVQAAIAQAQAKKLLSPHDALRVLQEALNKPALRSSERLIDLREKIYSDASDGLLKTVKQELASGSEEGKLKAIMALVDLQGLEGLASTPASKRQSGKELKRLRADLGTVADSVIQSAQNFDPASMTLEQAVSQVVSISSRLQTFDSVIPLFSDELDMVKEKLLRRKRDIAKLFDGLKELQQTLEEADNPLLWQQAMQTGDFQVLDKLSRKIAQVGLNSMHEIQDFEKCLAEWKEIRVYLLREIKEVKEKFTPEEAFEEVKIRLTRLVSLPGLRNNGQPWQRIHQREYEDIHKLMGDQLRVNDLYIEGELVGWEAVSAAARERQEELKYWQDWDKECSNKLNELRDATIVTGTHTSNVPKRKKKQDWEKQKETAQAVTDLISAGPHVPGKLVSVNSGKSERIRKENKTRQLLAEEALREANQQIELLSKDEEILFPTAEEFSSAVTQKDWELLERLLARGRAAGTMNPQEQKQLDVYTQVLADSRRQLKHSSIMDKLRGKQ